MDVGAAKRFSGVKWTAVERIFLNPLARGLDGFSKLLKRSSLLFAQRCQVLVDGLRFA